MPYLLLVAGILTGVYALHRFFLTADAAQVRAFFTGSAFVIFCLVLFFLALSRRLPLALVLLIVGFPFIWKFIKAKFLPGTTGQSAPDSSSPMTHTEALEILDLKDGASADDIQSAYKRLMQKVHPDNQGSDWMAVKLNQARDLLLDKH